MWIFCSFLFCRSPCSRRCRPLPFCCCCCCVGGRAGGGGGGVIWEGGRNRRPVERGRLCPCVCVCVCVCVCDALARLVVEGPGCAARPTPPPLEQGADKEKAKANGGRRGWLGGRVGGRVVGGGRDAGWPMAGHQSERLALGRWPCASSSSSSSSSVMVADEPVATGVE